jgi:ribonucleotide monophosphatase NagD (HAD superfamily)
VAPFFIGKPNPYMMRSALNYLGAHSEETIMIGDRMDTDIVGAVSSGLDTALVLTGVTRTREISRFPLPAHLRAGIDWGRGTVGDKEKKRCVVQRQRSTATRNT